MPLNNRSTVTNDSTGSANRWQNQNGQASNNGGFWQKAIESARRQMAWGRGKFEEYMANQQAQEDADAGTDNGNNGGGNGKGNNYNRYSYSYNGGSSGGGTASQPNNLAALAAALQAQKQARIDAINAANSALDKQASAMRDRYNASLQTIGNDYQKLRNQAEVNRYRAQFNQREALANRGALDTGAGRQETMAMNNNYNNNLNAISLQEAQERANVQRAINEMLANVEQQKAENMTNGLSDYTSALQNLINAQYSGYTPEGSAYYQQALQALGANSGAENSNYTAYLRALGYNV